MNSYMDSPQIDFIEAGVQAEQERKSIGTQTDPEEPGGKPGTRVIDGDQRSG
jgi:hypothetical protein